MLAAATLLFLIALPIVNCRSRNTFSIEELGEHFSAKDYDQGKRDKGMNQAINAHPKGDRGIITRQEGQCSDENLCEVLTNALRNISSECQSRKICNLVKGACRCDRPRLKFRDSACKSCLENGGNTVEVSLK